MSWIRTVLVALAFVLVAGTAWAGPPPMDPKRMSGLARPDPQVDPGTITVRCLNGGFSDPAIGATVTLEVTGADGKTETRTAVTVEQGRATFDGLERFVGGKAVAKVTLGGAEVASEPMEILAQAGSRVMLVQGAGTPAPRGAPAHGRPGGPSIPAPGTAFPLDGTTPGRLTVGTFDLGERKPIPGIDVTLTVTPPDGEPTKKTATSDRAGKVIFDKLLPPDTPAGTKLVVEGTLQGEAKKSTSFEMSDKAGMAVVLAIGGGAAAEQAPKRSQVPGPRRVKSLPQGSIRVRVVDASDQPVAGQSLVAVRKSAGGGTDTYQSETGADGIGMFEGVTAAADSLYFVEARYDGAPYQSPFFQLDNRGGVAVDIRVFETTSDFGLVRSRLRIDIDPAEDDKARVVQVYDVYVNGDKAFWPPGGLKIHGTEGAKGLVVMRWAEQWLDHDDDAAPFAMLAGPIPPQETVSLSVGFFAEHDGTLNYSWEPPFKVMETQVFVGDGFELDAPGAKELSGDSKAAVPEKTVYDLGEKSAGNPIEFAFSGLPKRDPIFRKAGGIAALAIAIAVLWGFVSRRREDLKGALGRHRTELLDLLAEQKKTGAPAAQRQRIIAVLDRVYRQEAALAELAKAGKATDKKTAKKSGKKSPAKRTTKSG